MGNLLSPSFPKILQKTVWVYLALVIIGVPILINPLGSDPFESVKMTFFRLLCGGLILIIGLVTLSTNQIDPVIAQIQQTWSNIPKALRWPLLYFVSIFPLFIILSINPWESIVGQASSLVSLISLVGWLLFIWGILLVQGETSSSNSDQPSLQLIEWAIIASVPVAMYGLIQFFQFDPIVWETDSVSPILSTLGRSIYLGEYLAVLIIVTLIYGMHATENRFRVGIILVLQISCFLLTIARGAWLGLMGGLFVLLLTQIRFRIGWRAGFAVGFVSLVAILGFLVIQSGGGILESLGNNARTLFDQRTGSNRVRLAIWRDSITLITASPFRFVFGYGLNMFETAYYTTLPADIRVFQDNFRVTDPHNFVLKLWIECGVIGVVGFLWFYLSYYMLLAQVYMGDQLTQTQRYCVMIVLCGMTGMFIPKLFNPIVSVHIMTLVLLTGMGIPLLKK